MKPFSFCSTGAFFVYPLRKTDVLRRQKFLEGVRGEPFFKKVSPKSTRGAGQKGFASFFFWRLEAQKKNQKNARAKGEPLSRNRKKNRIVLFVRALPRHPASF